MLSTRYKSVQVLFTESQSCSRLYSRSCLFDQGDMPLSFTMHQQFVILHHYRFYPRRRRVMQIFFLLLPLLVLINQIVRFVCCTLCMRNFLAKSSFSTLCFSSLVCTKLASNRSLYTPYKVESNLNIV